MSNLKYLQKNKLYNVCMPELPEVRTSSRLINNDIKNKKIINVTINVSKMIKEIPIKRFKESILNKTIKKVDNVAKFIVFHLNDGTIMLSHMRMEGKYRFQKNDKFGKHDHVIFKFKDGFLVYADTRKFGTFHIRNEDNYKGVEPLKKLGPFPSVDVLDEVYNRIHKKSIPIKSCLLDQTIVSGIGNIYVDEILWKSKIHPLIETNFINKTKLREILKNASVILNKATKENGSSIKSYLAYNKIKGNYQNFLEVHTKVGQKCSRCKTIITKIKVQGRGTYICSKCQSY